MPRACPHEVATWRGSALAPPDRLSWPLSSGGELMRGVLLSIAAAAIVAFSTPTRAVALAPQPQTAIQAAAVTPVFALQDNPVKDVNVDINVNRSGRWYASPVWIAIG